MANSLILHKRIETTTAKAKALRSFVEPLITKSKADSTHSRRVVFSYLQNKEAVSELFREISPKITDRAGGYTRILKTGTRLGDNADMCILELVDYNETYTADKKETKSKSRRRRSGGSKAKAEASVQDAEVVEEVKEEKAAATEAPEAKVEEPKADETSSEEKKDEEAK